MRIWVRGVGALAGALLMAATVGSGVASAKDPLVGSTYADASDRIGGWNAAAVVSSVYGSRLALDECIVTSWQRSNARDASGKRRPGAILVNLDCNMAVAAKGAPGNSVTTPEGKARKLILDRADFINANPEWCERNLDNCAAFCARNDGLCTVDLG